ncbi:MAG: hypothetical protein LBP72_10670 [Dysgonamonadaceae bacterium]|nr:hypothetical protein [Dysgonamonadaceae bacterium]
MAVGSLGIVDQSVPAVEVRVVAGGTLGATAPVVAVGASVVQRAIVAAPITGRRQVEVITHFL